MIKTITLLVLTLALLTHAEKRTCTAADMKMAPKPQWKDCSGFKGFGDVADHGLCKAWATRRKKTYVAKAEPEKFAACSEQGSPLDRVNPMQKHLAGGVKTFRVCIPCDCKGANSKDCPAMPKFNCLTKEMWTAEKSEWCCKEKKLGCPPKFNCMTREMWTDEKKAWCCRMKKLGCAPEPPLRKVGETCGACMCPATNFTAGKCEEGLECIHNPFIADAPGRCRKKMMCCKAMTAQCLACSAGMKPEEYCKFKPETVGCERRCPLLGCNPMAGCKEVDDDKDGCGDRCHCVEGTCGMCVAMGGAFQIGKCDKAGECKVMDVGCYKTMAGCEEYKKQQAAMKVCKAKEGGSCEDCLNAHEKCAHEPGRKSCFVGVGAFMSPTLVTDVKKCVKAQACSDFDGDKKNCRNNASGYDDSGAKCEWNKKTNKCERYSCANMPQKGIKCEKKAKQFNLECYFDFKAKTCGPTKPSYKCADYAKEKKFCKKLTKMHGMSCKFDRNAKPKTCKDK